jgi:hypothetical protein
MRFRLKIIETIAARVLPLHRQIITYKVSLNIFSKFNADKIRTWKLLVFASEKIDHKNTKKWLIKSNQDLLVFSIDCIWNVLRRRPETSLIHTFGPSEIVPFQFPQKLYLAKFISMYPKLWTAFLEPLFSTFVIPFSPFGHSAYK